MKRCLARALAILLTAASLDAAIAPGAVRDKYRRG